ncbi:MAG: helix-turn-helix domain-containing protein [Bacteriovoracaceae bacterium]|jgi:predicted XRE-type DNA-binding protein|nr:helix-turn-helix domain-containing protein [Bacteriovoracaceae bacterium]
MKFPKNKDIHSFLNSLCEDDFSNSLKANATHVERVKYELCKRFVIYLRDENMTQSTLAKKLDIDRSRINWIVKYRIEHFTIDKLYYLYNKLDPDFELILSRPYKK